MKTKQIDEEAKELDRLNLVSDELRREINRIKQVNNTKSHERELLEKLLKHLTNECIKKENDLKYQERNIFIQVR